MTAWRVDTVRQVPGLGRLDHVRNEAFAFHLNGGGIFENGRFELGEQRGQRGAWDFLTLEHLPRRRELAHQVIDEDLAGDDTLNDRASCHFHRLHKACAEDNGVGHPLHSRLIDSLFCEDAVCEFLELFGLTLLFKVAAIREVARAGARLDDLADARVRYGASDVPSQRGSARRCARELASARGREIGLDAFAVDCSIDLKPIDPGLMVARVKRVNVASQYVPDVVTVQVHPCIAAHRAAPPRANNHSHASVYVIPSGRGGTQGRRGSPARFSAKEIALAKTS